MLQVDAGDHALEAMIGTTVAAQGASYTLVRRLGSGGMSVVFEARRRADDGGESRTVVKVFTPPFVLRSKGFALTALQKEAGALSRLNQRAPPTPFVVRFYESGATDVLYAGMDVRLPWLALEYVHGGVMGTTLSERVEHAVEVSGHAFDVTRAAQAIEAVCEGISAVHEVGVIHRDIKPDNILCCGVGDDEVFKITDFGIARWPEAAATFGGLSVGTPGYAPLEQMAPDGAGIGPPTDVFALGCLAYFVLTGEDLFKKESVFAIIAAIHGPTRRSVRDAPGLDPELRRAGPECDKLDEIIARATATKPEDRPRTARELSTLLLAVLRDDAARSRRASRRAAAVGVGTAETVPEGRRFIVRHRPGDERVIQHVTWNSDGTALAVTTAGLACWTGTTWQPVPLPIGDPSRLRFVHQTAPGHWLVGGAAGAFFSLAGSEVHDLGRYRDPAVTLERASGDPDDLAVLVGRRGTAMELFAMIGVRTLRGMPLPGVASVNGLERLDDGVWLVVGRTEAGAGFACVYEPLEWRVTELAIPPCRSLLACAGLFARQLAVMGGTDGTLVIQREGAATALSLPQAAHVSAVALDPAGTVWACTAGRVFERRSSAAVLVESWSDPSWKSPLISVSTSDGVVRGMSADGGVIEGH